MALCSYAYVSATTRAGYHPRSYYRPRVQSCRVGRDMTARMVLARAPMERNDIFMEDSYGAELLCVFGCCYVHRVSSAVIVSPPGAVMSSGPRHDGQKGPRARACGTHRHFHGG